MFVDNQNSVPPSFTIGDVVYYSLLKNIFNLNLKPGEPLNVKSISEQLDVSRTPVRDALIKLAKEGLVDVFPQKGTSVSRIDIHRVEEELFLRQSLEVRAVTLFMKEHESSHIDALTKYISMQKECLTNNDYITCLHYDDAFHHVFFAAINKNLCWDTIQSMSGHYRRVRLMSIWDHDVFSGIIEQHQEMLKNIISGNVSAVQELYLEHSSALITQIDRLLEKYPDYFKKEKEDNFLLQDFPNR